MKTLEDKCSYYGKDYNLINRLMSNLSNENFKKFKTEFKNNSSKSSFVSTLSELKFINELNYLGYDIIYNSKYYTNGQNKFQTPDITISIDESLILGDVYRLGKTNEDELLNDFIAPIIDYLTGIESNYRVKICHDIFDINNITSLSLYKDDLQLWLKKELNLNDVFVVDNQLSFKIFGKHLKKYTQIKTDCYNLIYKPGRLFQNDLLKANKIDEKYLKYSELIKELGVPFFLFIEVDYLSGFNLDEFYEKFYYCSAGFDEKEYYIYMKKVKNKELGTCWSILGDFYKYSFLSGVLLHYNNQYYLLMSPLKNQIIYTSNYVLFVDEIKKRFNLSGIK